MSPCSSPYGSSNVSSYYIHVHSNDAVRTVLSLFFTYFCRVPRLLVQVEPFNNNPEFTPEQIEKASKACTAICMWSLAMYQYHFVALGVAPKVG